MKFKVGDKVYSLVQDKILTLQENFSKYFVFSGGECSYSKDGRHIRGGGVVLFTLDEAFEKGFISREQYDEHRPKRKRVLKQALVKDFEALVKDNGYLFVTYVVFENEEAAKYYCSGRNYEFIKLLDHTAVEVEE